MQHKLPTIILFLIQYSATIQRKEVNLIFLTRFFSCCLIHQTFYQRSKRLRFVSAPLLLLKINLNRNSMNCYVNSNLNFEVRVRVNRFTFCFLLSCSTASARRYDFNFYWTPLIQQTRTHYRFFLPFQFTCSERLLTYS